MSRHTRKYQCKKSTLLEYHEIIECIMAALDAKIPYTAGHSKRVSDMTEILCGLLDLNRSKTRMIHIAAHLHDIGKIGIGDAILNKEGKLDEQEWEMMKTHPQIDANILDKSHLLAPFSKIVLHHHERFDGKGYIYGLKGKEIPLGSRIIAICDSCNESCKWGRKCCFNRCSKPTNFISKKCDKKALSGIDNKDYDDDFIV